MFSGKLRCFGRHVEEQHGRGADQEADADVHDGLPSGALAIGGGDDDIVVRHLPVGVCVFQHLLSLGAVLPVLLHFQVLLHLQKISRRLGVPHVRLLNLLQVVLRSGPVLGFHQKKREEQAGADIVRMLGQHTGKLVDRRVVHAVLRELQGRVVALDLPRVGPDTAALSADIVQVADRRIVLRLQAHADDPLDQRIPDLP